MAGGTSYRVKSSSSAIRLRPHRSVRAAFPHTAPPESHPEHGSMAGWGWVIRGAGRGERPSRALKSCQVMRR